MNNQSKPSALESFKTDPIPKIVIKNSIPALIAMIMVMVYNLADTFFLGLTHNDLMVTAVSFATPLFMIFMSLGTLFGVGGTSVISRALGEGRTDYAKKACSFCMWACVAVGGVMMAVLWIFLDDVTVMLGASENSVGLTTDYLRIAVGCGVFSMISNCFSSIVRTEGEAMKAMTGTLIGNLLNMILDPIFILGFKWGRRRCGCRNGHRKRRRGRVLYHLFRERKVRALDQSEVFFDERRHPFGCLVRRHIRVTCEPARQRLVYRRERAVVGV